MVGYRSERGSFLPLMALGLAMVVLAALLLGAFGRATADRARAQTAADAAALAGVVEGEAAAAELARANGGELVSFRVDDGDTVVEVRVGGSVARARAALEIGMAPVRGRPPVH
jgi:outer membrane lipoprotein SlyB